MIFLWKTFEYTTKNDKITTISKGSEEVVRKKKRIRKDRVIIVCVLALVICFGIYKGTSWVIHTITSLLEPEVQQEVVQDKRGRKGKRVYSNSCD